MRALRTLVWTLTLVFVAFSVSQAKTSYAYVVNLNSYSVSVVNTSNNTVVKTIGVGTNPWGVAVNQAGTLAYVTNSGSFNVSVISTSTNTIVATIPVQHDPSGVVFSPNGKIAYVANWGSNSVSVINTGRKQVTATVKVQNNPLELGILPNGAFVYVTNTASKTVSVISTLTNAVAATIPVGAQPTSVAISPNGLTAYVTNYGANSVSVISTATNVVVNTINVSAPPQGAAVSPDGHWLYVANTSGNFVTVIDTATQTITATIVVGSNAVYVAFSQDSAFAYVTNDGSKSVSVINTASRTVVDTIAVGNAPAGVAVMGTMKVSTVVGGYVGDKGPATNAAMSAPYSSVLDGAGNLYVSDYMMNRIRKVDAAGNITTYAGTGICANNGDGIKASLAQLCHPNQLLFDSAGNLIVADGGNSRIRKISKTGIITTIVGTGAFGYTGDGGPALKAEIEYPYAMTYDATGNLYFTDLLACVVRKVDTSGTIATAAGNGTCGFGGDKGQATAAQLNWPRGVAVDSSGNLYIGDSVNHRVRKVDTSGIITTFAGNGQGGFSGDGGLATNAAVGSPHGLQVLNGVLYIANGGSARVRTVDLGSLIINSYAGSSYGYDGDGNGLLATRFTGPQALEFDPSVNPIFNDAFNGRVRRANANGIVSTYVGGFIGADGTSATSAALVYPVALAIDKSGNFYIADEEGNRVRKVSRWKITTIAGNGINGYSGDGGPGNSKNTELNEPAGVAVDSSGNVFIADTFNSVIREVNTSGTISTFATNANFNNLLQMATDSSNNIYVADSGACVVWKITPGAVVSIAAGVLFTCGYNGDGVLATTADLNGPYAIAFDASGNMYIADQGNARLREVNTSGIISTVAGDGNCNNTGDGGSATAAEVCPNSVAVDKSGTIYIADFNFGRMRKISGGIITAFGGTGNGFNGDGLWPLYTAFSDPVAVAVDSKGTVYELDDWDKRVRAIK